jgi:hypothetical protein
MKHLLTVLILLYSIQSHAEQELDPYSKDALTKTQDLLNSQVKRQEFIDKDQKAKAADDFVKQNVSSNPQINNEIYGLAADVFEKIAKDANGDATKMKEALDNYLRNPAAFAEKWTSEQKSKLNSISNKVPPQQNRP